MLYVNDNCIFYIIFDFFWGGHVMRIGNSIIILIMIMHQSMQIPAPLYGEIYQKIHN